MWYFCSLRDGLTFWNCFPHTSVGGWLVVWQLFGRRSDNRHPKICRRRFFCIHVRVREIGGFGFVIFGAEEEKERKQKIDMLNQPCCFLHPIS